MCCGRGNGSGRGNDSGRRQADLGEGSKCVFVDPHHSPPTNILCVRGPHGEIHSIAYCRKNKQEKRLYRVDF